MSTVRDSSSKAVAFLDLLGFTKYSTEDPRGALWLLADFQTVVSQKFHDLEHHSVQLCVADRQQRLAEETGISSFEDFLVLSDSVFIVSDAPDLFAKQVSHFMLSCFLCNATAHAFPSDPSKPWKVSVAWSDAVAGPPQLEEESWYPVLLRGGISYGDVSRLDMSSIYDGRAAPTRNLCGPAVVTAVGLGEFDKGPRLFCDQSFVSKLSARSVESLIAAVSGKGSSDVSEILWPAAYYDQEESFEKEIEKFHELLSPAVNFWRARNHEECGTHYFSLLQLLTRATLRYCKQVGHAKDGVSFVEAAFAKEGLSDKKEALLAGT